MSRARKLKFLLWCVIGLAVPVALSRFLFGLGAATNLSDANPWGLWIGFDVLAGSSSPRRSIFSAWSAFIPS
jgi:Ni/Fe-hydrogenase subunit HybB-like protein